MIDEGVERQRILVNLHMHGFWGEELLSEALFGRTERYMFTKQEFVVLEEMVRLCGMGYEETEARQCIAKELHVTVKTVRCYCDNIKSKFRNNVEVRVYRDVILPPKLKEVSDGGEGGQEQESESEV